MIKVTSKKIELGKRFCLSEAVLNLLFENSDECYQLNTNEFFVEAIHKVGRQAYVICKSCEMIDNQFIRFGMTKHFANYIFGKKVEDLNEGYSFNEYIPELGSEIMVTNLRNLYEIVPGKLELGFKIIEVDGESLKTFVFEFRYLVCKCQTSLNYFFRNARYTWKFVNSSDLSYMTDYEKVFVDTLIHKKFFMKSAEILITYLTTEGAIDRAKQLKERAIIHDNSKIENYKELEALSKIIDDKSNLKNPRKPLNKYIKKSIKLHWKNNSHHPEHFKNIWDMERIDVMEMCIDWHARSLQFGTDFMEFVISKNESRFHFPDCIFSEILHYCNILQGNNM